MLTINTLQLEKLLESLVLDKDIAPEVRTPIMVAGPPGCGKSGTIEGLARRLGWECLVLHPVVSDPTDFKGFPWVDRDKQTADFMPFGMFAKLLHAAKPTICFLDDVGHAPKAVQATLMQPLFARMLNDKRISDKVVFILATNRRGDKAGVEGIIDPIINRCLVYEMKEDLDTFLAFWIKAGYRPEVLAFLRVFPKHLYEAKRTTDIANFPSYRTWEFASRVLDRQLGPDLELIALSGAVGEGVAGEFMAYLKLYRDIPDPDEIIKNPEKGKVPEKADVLYALCAALAYRCTTKTFKAIATYTERMVKAGREEMAVYLLGDALRRCPEVAYSEDCAKVIDGKLGQLLLAE